MIVACAGFALGQRRMGSVMIDGGGVGGCDDNDKNKINFAEQH